MKKEIDLEPIRSYLYKLITPQNYKEKQYFKNNNLVDAYIKEKNNIDAMTDKDLICIFFTLKKLLK